ncbi:hypothetical protein I8748_24730 [Nostoc sp. CENA67]|uniref:Uncharacterized protein n=1 Tax=Amazonocrinis nigriterrae CENA67 TaxID=2794033 RepID=A0A8J7HSH3_9NOST|nr:hypothetical protein [Amazonocrinis nigriterrae]MBH8565348.1 hypothetical protein [Amazonocrinis nigriterrae CENA67]
MTNNLENVDFTPSEIAMKLSELEQKPISNRQVNQLLEQLGLQRKFKSSKGKWKWQLTQVGKKYGRVYSVTNTLRNWSGNQIKWSEEVISLIQQNWSCLTA